MSSQNITASARRGVTARVLRNPMGVAAAVALLVLIVLSVGAPLFTPYPMGYSNLDAVLAPPGAEHLLGGDGSGRDIWTQLLYGGRSSLLAGFIVVAVALCVGVPTGLIAGYRNDWFDSISAWLANLLMSLPGIIVLLAVIARFGSSMAPTMIALGVLVSPFFFRLTRSTVQTVRGELYIDAAKVSGLSERRIIGRHILSVVRTPIIIQTSLVFGGAVAAQAGLEFLGLGDAATASWGAMINDAFRNIFVAPWLMIAPGIILGMTVASCALLGNALGDALKRDTPASRSKRPKATATPKAAPVAVPPPAAHLEGPTAAVAPKGSQALLVVENLVVEYPGAARDARPAVDGVSFSLQRGEVLGLVGESGSGKTQTALSVLGLLPASAQMQADRIAVTGNDLRSLNQAGLNLLRGTRMAYVPQEPMSNLDPTFTIGHQLVRPIRHHLGLSPATARTRALELLDRVGIPDPRAAFDAYPHQISGGMAQRVLIAGAVSCDPELLIADEPTTALDVTVQAEVLDLMRSLQREGNMGMLIVTHDFGVVADICDRVAVMRHGKIVEQNSALGIFEQPAHPYTRMLLGSVLDAGTSRRALDAARGKEAEHV